MRKPRRIKPYGPQALLLEWQQEISPSISQGVHGYAKMISKWPGVVECVPAYASLLVKLDNRSGVETVRERIYFMKILEEYSESSRIIQLPVCYGGEYGADLPQVAAATNLSRATITELHSQPIYQVYQLGFQPGFAFLGQLDQRLAMPRKAVPRTVVPAGSVAIAERQTAIYPSPSPGGWQLIGRCPVPMVDFEAERPERLGVLQAGDKVRFTPINVKEFLQYQQQPQSWWKQSK